MQLYITFSKHDLVCHLINNGISIIMLFVLLSPTNGFQSRKSIINVKTQVVIINVKTQVVLVDGLSWVHECPCVRTFDPLRLFALLEFQGLPCASVMLRVVILDVNVV